VSVVAQWWLDETMPTPVLALATALLALDVRGFGVIVAVTRRTFWGAPALAPDASRPADARAALEASVRAKARRRAAADGGGGGAAAALAALDSSSGLSYEYDSDSE